MTKEKKAFNWNGPRLIHEHIQNQIDINKFDFEQQLHRKTTHELFTVVVSQFSRNEKYYTIVKDIKENLDNPIYEECLRKVKFNSLNGKLITLAMRYKVYWLIKLYSEIHSF